MFSGAFTRVRRALLELRHNEEATGCESGVREVDKALASLNGIYSVGRQLIGRLKQLDESESARLIENAEKTFGKVDF